MKQNAADICLDLLGSNPRLIVYPEGHVKQDHCRIDYTDANGRWCRVNVTQTDALEAAASRWFSLCEERRTGAKVYEFDCDCYLKYLRVVEALNSLD